MGPPPASREPPSPGVRRFPGRRTVQNPKSTFAPPDAQPVGARHARIIEQLKPRFPRVAQMLAE
jgi:hypothetical protein